MACTEAFHLRYGSGHAAMSTALSIIVWRTTGSDLEWVFTYVGSCDALVVVALLQHVEILTGGAAGAEWYVEVIASGYDLPLLGHVKDSFRSLRGRGLHQRLVIVPRRSAAGSASLATSVPAAFDRGAAILH